MSLKSGQYTITSKLHNAPVGRNIREDKSLLPKRVVTLPEGVEAPKWDIEKAGNGSYILKIGGSPTAEIDKLVFAVLLDEPQATKWKIEPKFHHGPNTYTITVAADSGTGWFVPDDDEPETQVTVRPLIVGPSLPPYYPPTELFVITKV